MPLCVCVDCAAAGVYQCMFVNSMAKLKNISFEEFSDITSKNFFRLFGNLN